MDRRRHEILPGLWADAGRALFLESESLLAVADLHLGYAWAHRHAGQLLPLKSPADDAERLVALLDLYRPRMVTILGDIVHRAVPLPAVQKELDDLINVLMPRAILRLIGGNHDRGLDQLLAAIRPELRLEHCLDVETFSFVHGDGARPTGLVTIMGHEHPAISISDGVTTDLRCPCFLVSERLVVLPAFSRWAAGCNVRSGRFLSSLAREAKFTRALAIIGTRLLPVDL